MQSKGTQCTEPKEPQEPKDPKPRSPRNPRNPRTPSHGTQETQGTLGTQGTHATEPKEPKPQNPRNPRNPNELNGTNWRSHVSWTVQVLPFLEQTALYDGWVTATNNFVGTSATNHSDFHGTTAPMTELHKDVRIDAFYCPSYTGGSKIGGTPVAGATHYDNGNGIKTCGDAPEKDSQTGLLCYRGNFGKGTGNSFDQTDGQGAFGWKTRQGFKNFTDGTSSSIMLLENAFGVGWATGTTTLSMARSYPGNKSAINQAALSFRDVICNIGLGSEHPSGANVSMIDGSTKFLSFSLNAAVFDNLMQVNDGSVVDLP